MFSKLEFVFVSDAQKRLLEAGVLDLYCDDGSGVFYKNPQTKADTVRVSCGFLIKLFSNPANANLISPKKDELRPFIKETRKNHA